MEKKVSLTKETMVQRIWDKFLLLFLFLFPHYSEYREEQENSIYKLKWNSKKIKITKKVGKEKQENKHKGGGIANQNNNNNNNDNNNISNKENTSKIRVSVNDLSTPIKR